MTFDKPFDAAPTVVVSFVTSTLASSNPVTTKISSVSTTGFKVCLARPEGTYAPGTVNWLAIPRL
ncbi:MAG: H-type lectin domain-containing protein [Clostridia bacterium]